MSTTIINGYDIGPVLVSGANSQVIVKQGATLMLGAVPGGMIGTIMESTTVSGMNYNNVYTINGRILGVQIGMYLSGSNDDVNIGASGSVHGMYGVVLAGKGDHVSNDGKIIGDVISPGTGYGIFGYVATDLVIDNTGIITGDTAIGFQGVTMTLTNSESGRIIGNSSAITAQGPGNNAVEFTNHGYVAGKGGYAFLSDGNDATVINDGRIRGQIVFGNGDDLLDNRGGALSNLTVVGGAGNDTLIVDDNKHFLLESAAGGTDTIKSTVSYALPAEVERLYLIGKAKINGTGSDGDNQIFGNAGNNSLSGKGGTDHLYGGKGADNMTGGTGTDMFHFNTGDGHDRIQDFHHLEDKINLNGWAGVNSLTKVLADAHNQGANVLIEHGTDSLLLIGVHKADLTVDDFAF
jgi:Ca2+-binding RTX toxin-like protein